MTTRQLASALTLTILLPTLPAAARDLPAAIRVSAACAPVGTRAPSDVPIVTGTESDQKMLYYAGEDVAIDAGTDHGLQVGQRFFVRRPMSFRGAPRAQHTVGWLRIVRASQSTATATIDFTCDAVAVGDHLEPYVEPVLPPGIDRTDSTGRPDPSKAATVLYGNDGRQLGGDRDFMLASAGRDKGVEPGARYAVYHHGGAHGEQRVAFGEAVVVSVFADKALLRITDANDTVSTGDTLVLRRGGTGLFADTGSDAQEGVLNGAGDEGSSPAARRSVEASTEPLRSVAFEDLSFDFDRYTLKAEALTLLDQAVGVLQENPTVRIQIEGYSCNIGTAKYNLALGERRANAVRDYLMSRGVRATQMTTLSYGEERPKYDNAREDTRRLNRRAALVVNIQR